MANIDLVIKIPEDIYKLCQGHGDVVYTDIAKGTPLTKGQWLRMSDLSESADDRYQCSRCGNVVHHKNTTDLYTFNSWCGRCGSNNFPDALLGCDDEEE